MAICPAVTVEDVDGFKTSKADKSQIDVARKDGLGELRGLGNDSGGGAGKPWQGGNACSWFGMFGAGARDVAIPTQAGQSTLHCVDLGVVEGNLLERGNLNVPSSNCFDMFTK